MASRSGQGGFGEVWKVYESGAKKFYALKLEPATARNQSLHFEISVLKAIQGSQRFPRYVSDGVDEGRRYVVEELLGPNLQMILANLTGRLVCTPYLARLADEMLSCIQDFHRFGFVHRDIKPENFVVRLDGDVPICLLDFGNARKFQNEGQIIGARDLARIPGSPVYASPNLGKNVELGRKDDLISWIYSIVALSGRTLPWNAQMRREEVTQLKDQHSLLSLCEGLPSCFQKNAEHVTQLEFASVPNYAAMHQWLAEWIPSTGRAFEWMEMEVEGVQPGGKWDPTGFLMSISPFLREEKECLLL
jgi:serine/threonine protein kinase